MAQHRQELVLAAVGRLERAVRADELALDPILLLDGGGQLLGLEGQGLGRPPGLVALAAQRLLLPAAALFLQALLVQELLLGPEELHLARHLVGAPGELDEHRHLGPQHPGDDRLEQEVHRAQLVAGQHLLLVAGVGGQEDDGRVPARPCARG